MGTRHLICVQKGDLYKIAQYGQWDGYPAGQGAEVLEFLIKTDMREFEQKLSNVRFVSKEEMLQLWYECGMKEGETHVDSVTHGRMRSKYPWLTRDAGAEVLSHVLNSDGEIILKDSLLFAGDSMMCEWCYVVDLDSRTFEVYRGFNKKPLRTGDRFNFLKVDQRQRNVDIYYPVRLVKTYFLNSLPTIEEFVIEFESRD